MKREEYTWPKDARFEYGQKVALEFGVKHGKVIAAYQATGRPPGYVVEFLGGVVNTYAESSLRPVR
jgi:hypothetical protein